jgi:hypothetical protein
MTSCALSTGPERRYRRTLSVMSADPIAAVAQRQDGLVTRAQVLALGMSKGDRAMAYQDEGPLAGGASGCLCEVHRTAR